MGEAEKAGGLLGEKRKREGDGFCGRNGGRFGEFCGNAPFDKREDQNDKTQKDEGEKKSAATAFICARSPTC